MPFETVPEESKFDAILGVLYHDFCDDNAISSETTSPTSKHDSL